MIHAISFVVLIAGMIVAVWSDFKQHKIPNVLSVTMLVSGLIINMFEPSGLRQTAIGFLVGFLIGVFLWLLSVVKAGDAKLMAAIGAMMGWRWFIISLCWAILIGMGIGIVILLRKREVFSRIKRVWEYGKLLIRTQKFTPYEPQKDTEGELPFAIPLAIGCILNEFIALL